MIQPFGATTINPYDSSRWYVSDPTVSASSYRSELLHHALTDVVYPTSGCTSPDNAIGTRISYRRGTSAAAIVLGRWRRQRPEDMSRRDRPADTGSR